MAHFQYHGERFSYQRKPVVLGQSIPLELWGPYKQDGGEFLMVTSDWDAIQLAPKPVKDNVRVYTATAKGLSSNVKIEIVAGELADKAQNPELGNLKKPYISCDEIHLWVVPDSGKVLWADYFDEVIPAIAAGLDEYNTSNPGGIVNKAGFLLVQTYHEQSPGDTKKPSVHGNRMFNVQALVSWKPNGQPGDPLPGQTTDAGVFLKSLSQGEGPSDASRKNKSSSTFYYDSPKTAVTHYLKVLQKRYSSAYTVLTDAGGSFGRFASALQNSHFATEEAYASKLNGIVDQVLGQAKTWLDCELNDIDHDIASSAHASEREALKKRRASMADFQDQVKQFKR